MSCDHVTGACQRKCPPGRHGENCDQGRWPDRGLVVPWLCLCPPMLTPVCPVSDCPVGRFGAGCVHPCNCTGSPCDKVSGRCKCPAGTAGKRCENCECGRTFEYPQQPHTCFYMMKLVKVGILFPQMVFGVQGAQKPALLVRTAACATNTTGRVTALRG